MRVAFASMAWNTGSSSPGELEMTCSTSEVAVCCSSASESSRVRACTSSNSRTFSIAITAWSAKVVTSSICLSVNGCTVLRCKTMTPIGDSFPQQRDAEHRPEPANLRGLPKGEFRVGQHIVNMNGSAFQHGAADDRPAPRWNRMNVS